jgi:ABC-type cobalamin/Fe3+-siderophores transport system ATPase subunit
LSILMSTHQPEHALRVADRIALLKAWPHGRAGATRLGADATEVFRSLPLVASAP